MGKKTTLLALALLISASFCLAESPKEHASWWIEAFGAVSPDAGNIHAKRALAVFERVSAAADKRANRPPRLVIVRKKAEPFAAALPDGSVILSLKALEICYEGVDENTGDARLAFVLGHELAHLAKDDFWHLQAFEFISKFGSDKKAVDELVDLLRKTENISKTEHARAIFRKKELQADAYGLLYASAAGYDPNVVAGNDETDFFRYWSDRVAGKAAYYDENNPHPSPELRRELVVAEMESIRDRLVLFELGVLLYQLGKYQDSMDFLSSFQKSFPSREVSNNLGLAQFQLAMKNLSRQNPEKANRFYLSTSLDPHTRAAVYSRGAARDLAKAVDYFDNACQKDPFYCKSRVNLSSALIMTEKYSDALAALDSILPPDDDLPEVLNNRAVALYQFGLEQKHKVDLFKNALALLQDAIRIDSEFAPSYYNLGRLFYERNRNAAAADALNRFLTIEPFGFYADSARGLSGTRLDSARMKHETPPDLQPAVSLGRMNPQTRSQLESYERKPLNAGGSEAVCYTKGEILVLVLDDVVEVVKMPASDQIKLPLFQEEYGAARRVFQNPDRTRTMVYAHFAVKTDQGKLLAAYLFQPQ